MPPIDTAVIGAGPYGLSIAAHLREAGIPYRIFGEPLESWRDFMPKGMLLKSEPFASTLWDPKGRFRYWKYLSEKGIPFRPVRDPVPVERFLDYAEWFRARAVDDVNRVKVRRVTRAGDGFSLDLRDGTVCEARRVVVATGHMSFCNVPEELKGLPEGLCLHSTALHDLGRFAGRDVTVIGAGQSALESLALLHEAGAKVRLVARREKLTWNGGPRTNPTWIDRLREPEAGLGSGWGSLAISELPVLYRGLLDAHWRHRHVLRSWGPSGAWWLRQRIEGKIELLLGHRIEVADVEGGRVRLGLVGPTGAVKIPTDHVVSATGFDVALDRIECLDPALRAEIAREGRYARLSAHFETSVEGLFIVGLAAAPVFGPALRFMWGGKHAAPAVARFIRYRRARASIPWSAFQHG